MGALVLDKTAVLLRAAHAWGRFGYLMLSVAAMVAAWLVLAALASPFLQIGQTADANDSLRVVNARNKNTPLPLKYAERLATVDGVASVHYADLQMLLCGDSTVTVNAVGGTTTDAASFKQAGYTANAVKRWQADPIGVLVSRSAAQQCGWQVGQGVDPLDVQGQPIPIRIIAIADVDDDDSSVIAHYDYINQQHSLVAGAGRVLSFSVQAQNPKNNQSVAERIDATFAHDDPPLTAYPDTAREDARSRFGKVQYLVVLVMGAIFLSCALVLSSVMTFAAIERRPQLGVLRVLGFPRRWLAFAFVLEVMAILAVGALMGIALGELALHYLPAWLQGSVLRVSPAVWAYQLLPVGLVVLALITLVRPCLVALRAHPLDCRGD